MNRIYTPYTLMPKKRDTTHDNWSPEKTLIACVRGNLPMSVGQLLDRVSHPNAPAVFRELVSQGVFTITVDLKVRLEQGNRYDLCRCGHDRAEHSAGRCGNGASCSCNEFCYELAPDECRICHRSVCIEDGLEDDGVRCCHTCRIAELERQLEEAKKELAADDNKPFLDNAVTLDLPDVEWTEQYVHGLVNDNEMPDGEWLDKLDSGMRMCPVCNRTVEDDHECKMYECAIALTPAQAKGLRVVLEDIIHSGRYVNAITVLQPVLDDLVKHLG